MHLSLFNVSVPANATNYLAKLRPIISFNLMKYLKYVNDWVLNFDYKGQDDLKVKYLIAPIKDIGFSSFNFLMNSGNVG